MSACCNSEIFGADPVRIKWNIVRGDTGVLRIDFKQDDEVTYFDTSEWSYSATSYDPKTDILDELTVNEFPGYIEIVAPSDITSLWGSGYNSVVAELTFDLEVVTGDGTTWTPVIGTITVLGDVTGGRL